MFEDYPDILSPEEAAEALRIGENAIYELLNEGKLKVYVLCYIVLTIQNHQKSGNGMPEHPVPARWQTGCRARRPF